MAEEIVGKVQFLELQRRRDLDLVLGHMAYRRASLIDLYVHNQILLKFFMDGLTAGTPPSSRSRDTETRTNFKNLARSNLNIVL